MLIEDEVDLVMLFKMILESNAGLKVDSFTTVTKSGPTSIISCKHSSSICRPAPVFLWYALEKAIPEKQRIKEIEEGLKREFIETIQDATEIQNLVSKIISSATEEVDIVFSTANTFKSYEKEGIIELLTGRVDEDGLKVRILVNQNYEIQQTIDKLMKKHSKITIRNLDKSVQTKVNTIMADNEVSLVSSYRIKRWYSTK